MIPTSSSSYSTKKLKVICQKDAEDLSVTYRCPTGWRRHKDHCYKGINRSGTWDWHRDNCNKTEGGAWLASIKSQSENNFIHNYFKTKVDRFDPHPAVWGGLRQYRKVDKFRWLDGSFSVYEHWDKGWKNPRTNRISPLPRQWTVGNHCLMLFVEGRYVWHDNRW